MYAAVYDRALNTVREIQADIVDENYLQEYLDKGPVYFFGDGAEKCKTKITHPHAFFVDRIAPIAKNMCPLAERAIARDEYADVAYFEPFYLKEFVVSKPKAVF